MNGDSRQEEKWNFSLPITNVSFSALYNSEERYFFLFSEGDFCALWSHYQSQPTVNHTHNALDLTVDIKMSLLVTALEGLQHGQTQPYESVWNKKKKTYQKIRLCGII